MVFFLCPTAPSIVPIMHQISSTMNSFTLSWPQPEQPNGIILDYELRYYEKVRLICVCVCVNAWYLSDFPYLQYLQHCLQRRNSAHTWQTACGVSKNVSFPGYLWAESPGLIICSWLCSLHLSHCSLVSAADEVNRLTSALGPLFTVQQPVLLWKCIASGGSHIDLSAHTQ